jgi:hypothetical protein
VVVRSEANIRELLDRVKEMLAHKEILQYAAMSYLDGNRTAHTQLTKNEEILYQLNKLSLEVTKDTLRWVLREQDSFLNQFVQSPDRYEMLEPGQDDLTLRN